MKRWNHPIHFYMCRVKVYHAEWSKLEGKKQIAKTLSHKCPVTTDSELVATDSGMGWKRLLKQIWRVWCGNTVCLKAYYYKHCKCINKTLYIVTLKYKKKVRAIRDSSMKVSHSPQHGQQSCYGTLGQDLSGPHCGARTIVDPVLKRLNSDDLVSEGESSLRAPTPLRDDLWGDTGEPWPKHLWTFPKLYNLRRRKSFPVHCPTNTGSQLPTYLAEKATKVPPFFQLCRIYLGHRSVWAMSVLRERLNQIEKYLHWTSPLDKPEVILQVKFLTLS